MLGPRVLWEKKKQMYKVRCFSDKRYYCFDQDLNTHTAPTRTRTNVIEVQKVLEDLVLIILVTLRKQTLNMFIMQWFLPLEVPTEDMPVCILLRHPEEVQVKSRTHTGQLEVVKLLQCLQAEIQVYCKGDWGKRFWDLNFKQGMTEKGFRL